MPVGIAQHARDHLDGDAGVGCHGQRVVAKIVGAAGGEHGRRCGWIERPHDDTARWLLNRRRVPEATVRILRCSGERHAREA
mgnify:CR=1 FL=1